MSAYITNTLRVIVAKGSRMIAENNKDICKNHLRPEVVFLMKFIYVLRLMILRLGAYEAALARLVNCLCSFFAWTVIILP